MGSSFKMLNDIFQKYVVNLLAQSVAYSIGSKILTTFS